MRFVTLTLVATLALSLAACGDSSVEQSAKETASKTAATAPGGAVAPPAGGPQAAAPVPAAAPAPAATAGDGKSLVMELKGGKVTIDLRPDIAPKHVARIKQLTKEGFFNGLKFHRVIDGFMAQTGDPSGTGMGGSEYANVPAEFTSTPFERGTVGAARAKDRNSANSQFFICFNDQGCKSLTGSYTVWGKVASGMDAVDKIKKGDAANGGTVSGPDTIVKMYLQ